MFNSVHSFQHTQYKNIGQSELQGNLSILFQPISFYVPLSCLSFRHFGPHSEMPTARERRAALVQLWASTADVMVIVERGTEPGFQLVLEARDYMLR
jgi:hypothetical protein